MLFFLCVSQRRAAGYRITNTKILASFWDPKILECRWAATFKKIYGAEPDRVAYLIKSMLENTGSPLTSLRLELPSGLVKLLSFGLAQFKHHLYFFCASNVGR